MQEEHDEHLTIVLQKVAAAGITLKCEFSCKEIRFLGQLVDSQGIRADPSKVKAVQQMKESKNISEFHRFLGMINQLDKFTPKNTKPKRDLSTKNQWIWGSAQQRAFRSNCVLTLFAPCRKTCVSADASSFGLGAILTYQQPSGEWKPVAYISRSTTPTEQRYAQIEKEALAVTWACEWFRDYLIGLTFHIQIDHKPLVLLFTSKSLDELPIQAQRFRLRLMHFNFTVSHVPGKDLVVADALSRAPVSSGAADDQEFQQDVEAYINLAVQQLPASEHRLKEIMAKQQEDDTCKTLIQYCHDNGPHHSHIASCAKPYLSVAAELSMCNGLLLRGERIVVPQKRIVVPQTLQEGILGKLHCGHQGITKCHKRARQSVWWPGINKDIEVMISKCLICSKHKQQGIEKFMAN